MHPYGIEVHIYTHDKKCRDIALPYKPVGFVKQMMIGRSPDLGSLPSCVFPITLSDIMQENSPIQWRVP